MPVKERMMGRVSTTEAEPWNGEAGKLPLSSSRLPLRHFSRFCLSFGFVFAGILTTWLGSLLPWLCARWNLGPAVAGNFFIAQFGGSSLGVILNGWLLAKAGYRNTLALGLAFMSVGTLSLLAAHPGQALLGWALAGFGMGLLIPAGNLALAQASGAQAAGALNGLNLAWGAGALAAPALVAGLMHGRHPLLTLALLALAQLGLGLALRWDRAPWPALTPAPWRGMMNRRWGWLGLCIFLYVGAENSAGGWIATLGRASGLHRHFWLWLPWLFWAGLLGGRALAPLWLRWISDLRLARISAFVAGCGFALFMAVRLPDGLLAAALLTGLGLAAIFPILLAQIPRLSAAENQVRPADPWLFLFGGLGGAVFPALLGRFAGGRAASVVSAARLRGAMLLPGLALAVIFYFLPRLRRASAPGNRVL